MSAPLRAVADPPPDPANVDVDAERAVLGAVLLGAPVANLAGLRPCHFYREAHGLIWSAVLDLHHDRRLIDPLVLTDYLARAGTLEAAGGRGEIDGLATVVPHLANAAEYALIVRRAYQWRRRSRAVHELREAVAARDDVRYRDALEKAG
jgi:replicative DNA helicase